MASCAAGAYSGTAKANIGIVPVKILEKKNSRPLLSDVVAGVGFVLADTSASAATDKSVLSMSIGFPLSELQVDLGVSRYDPFEDLLPRLYGGGIVPVASAGNWADKTDGREILDTQTPRKNGGRNTQLIVVGACDHQSIRWQFSNQVESGDSGILTLYAYGVDNVGAATTHTNTFKRESGTSPATAHVAGLVANYLAAGGDAGGAKSAMINQAISRKGNAWPDGVPRAATNIEFSCTPVNLPPMVTIPAWDEPDLTFILDKADLPENVLVSSIADGDLVNAFPLQAGDCQLIGK